MSGRTHAELEAVCAEFSRNFAQLEQQYTAQGQNLTAEKSRSASLLRQLEAAMAELAGAQEETRRMAKELSDAQQYKDRAYTTGVAMEHLKGRLESARRAISDKDTEHAATVDQYKSQIKDLMARVETNADAPLMHTLRNQRIELEERCAVLNGQLLEEREKSQSQQVTAAAMLRDLQNRTMELEQRCRQYESDTAQLRAAARKATEQRTYGSSQCEQLLLEKARLEAEVDGQRKELHALASKREEDVEHAAATLAARERQWEFDRQDLLQRLAAATNAADEMAMQRTQDAEKMSALQRSISTRVVEAREESRAEIEALTKSKSDMADELQRQRWKCKQSQDDIEEVKQKLVQLEGRLAACEQKRTDLQSKLEQSIQDEAWTASERDKAVQQLQKAQQRLDEASGAMKENDTLKMDLERAKIALSYSNQDIEETQKQMTLLSSQHQGATQQLEFAYLRKIEAMDLHFKEQKRSLKLRIRKLDKQRKKLLVTELSGDVGPHTYGGYGPPDPLAALKQQSEAAKALHNAVVEAQGIALRS